MLIQLASDLHLEMLNRHLPQARIIEPAPGADLLVLAGDVHNGVRGVEAFADWSTPVLYVAGNHEFYDQNWEQTRGDIRRACAGTRVTFLDNDAIELEGVRFLGCTLWTDFCLRGTTQEQAMGTVERGLNDYHVIRTGAGLLRAQQTLADHERSRNWLEGQLAQPFAGKTVVISHHGPHPLSIHPRFVGNRMNPGFVSDLTPLLHDMDLWLHGHTHDGFDYRLGRCRVVANPVGYVLNRTASIAGAPLAFENSKFNTTLVVEVPT